MSSVLTTLTTASSLARVIANVPYKSYLLFYISSKIIILPLHLDLPPLHVLHHLVNQVTDVVKSPDSFQGAPHRIIYHELLNPEASKGANPVCRQSMKKRRRWCSGAVR